MFPPETFARIQWLLDINNLLSKSPKPEAHWLTSPPIDNLINEAKKYLETSIWIKNTRTALMERYNPAFFTLTINRSVELQQAVSALSKILPAVNIEEGECLAKRENLLAFIKNTQAASRKWQETSQALYHSSA